MGRFFWIIIGIAGLVLIALIVSGDTGKTLGFESGQFASASIMALWALLIGGAAFGGGVKFGDTIKQLSIWVLIIVSLMGGYVFRYDLQDIGSRMTGGIIPGSPISTMNDNGRTVVTLIRSDNGHFEATADVNGQTVNFLVDTGASAIVLSHEDAKTVGINTDNLAYTIVVQTANGAGRSARARIDSLYVGGIERKKLRVMVAEPGKLGQSLLGQQFLESLSSYEKRGDRLTLRD